MIDRRKAVGALTCALLGLSFDAAAQPPAKVRRIGYLAQGSAVRDRPYTEGLRQGLRNLGWIEGRNIDIVERFADGRTDKLPALAVELVNAKADVIVTWSTPAALAAKRATATIPIVMGFAADPVASGIVANLAHPGTGWTHIGLELRAKYLELLTEAVPEAVRVGVLWNPKNQVHKPSLEVIQAAARQLNVQLDLVGVQEASQLDSTFAKLVADRVQALIVFPDGMFVAQTALILSLAARSRLPALYGVKEYVEGGGLMFYGANLVAMQRDIGASIVDKILKGARPSDLPVERPTKFELVINLKTAKALALTIPQSVLLRADELIQ